MTPRPGMSGERGTTTVEYGLLVGAVGLAAVVAGPALADAFRALLDLIMEGMLGGS